MSITTLMNATVNSSGATGGPIQMKIPTVTSNAALDLRGTFQIPANTFVTLTSLFGQATLTGASYMWLLPTGTTVCNCYYGQVGTMALIQTGTIPAMVSAGLTTPANVGICLSAANSYEIVIV